MPLTVGELIEIPYLRTRLLAGAAGVANTVKWAHVCEVERPWEWLEPGDLLLTIGAGVPSDPDAQAAYVEQIAQAGLSGIAIAEDMEAPPLSEAMMQAADRRALPVLSTAYEVPWTQVARAVAAGNRSREQAAVVEIARLYEQVRIAAREGAPPGVLIRQLGDQLGCELTVLDLDIEQVAVPNTPSLAADVQARVVAELRNQKSGAHRILRVSHDTWLALVVPVPTRYRTAIVAVAPAADPPPIRLLEHVATLAALEVDRLWAARESERRLGQELFAALVDGRLPDQVARASLRRHSFPDTPRSIVAVDERGDAGDIWHRWLVGRGTPHLLLPRDGALYALLPADAGVVDEAVAANVAWLPAGISDPFVDPSRTGDAVREARWALQNATEGCTTTTRYGDSASVFGPRSIKEAHEAVDRVLAPVLQYDQEHGTELIRSLAAFLRHNRSWQTAAAELFVHKQTLVYRIRRVEEITGRSLTNVDDLVELWLGLRALDLLT